MKSTFWWGLYFFFFFSIFFLLFFILFLLLISQNTVYKKKTLISHVSTTMLFSQLSKENIWKSVFQRELVQWRSRAGIFWWYSRAQFKRRFTPQTAVQFLKKMPQLTQTAVSPHTMVRIVNLCLNCAPLCTKRFMLYYATEPAPSEKPIFFEVRIRWTWATPPNSEIIFVQNVGAKVEMISYLKK